MGATAVRLGAKHAQQVHKSQALTPHCVMRMGNFGLLFAPTVTFSTLRTVSMPSITYQHRRTR